MSLMDIGSRLEPTFIYWAKCVSKTSKNSTLLNMLKIISLVFGSSKLLLYCPSWLNKMNFASKGVKSGSKYISVKLGINFPKSWSQCLNFLCFSIFLRICFSKFNDLTVMCSYMCKQASILLSTQKQTIHRQKK